MKYSVLSFSCGLCLSLFSLAIFAASSYPQGSITIHNASDKTISAQVSSYGKFNLAANEHKTVSYSTLAAACSGSPTNCRTQFYVDAVPAGSATINTVTGKLVHMKLSMKVQVSKENNVLRNVIIK